MIFYQRLSNLVFRKNRYSIKHILFLFSIIFLFWSAYRHFPGVFPVWFEELILKPLFWLLPTFWLVKKVEGEKITSLGFSRKKIGSALAWGGGLGLVFAIEGFSASALKNQGLAFVNFSFLTLIGVFVVAGATAMVEEIVFRGYIFTRLEKIWADKWLANLMTALLFTVTYLPASIYILGYRPHMMIIYLFFIFCFGLVSGFVRFRTNNLWSSVLLHFFWSWPSLIIGQGTLAG